MSASGWRTSVPIGAFGHGDHTVPVDVDAFGTAVGYRLTIAVVQFGGEP